MPEAYQTWIDGTAWTMSFGLLGGFIAGASVVLVVGMHAGIIKLVMAGIHHS
jgi:hypothetical protein